MFSDDGNQVQDLQGKFLLINASYKVFLESLSNRNNSNVKEILETIPIDDQSVVVFDDFILNKLSTEKKLPSCDEDLEFSDTNSESIYVVIGKLKFLDTKKVYAVCVVPGGKSINNIIQIIHLQQHVTKKTAQTYNKIDFQMRNYNNDLNFGMQKYYDYQISKNNKTNLSFRLYLDLIVCNSGNIQLTKETKLRIEMLWNSTWGYATDYLINKPDNHKTKINKALFNTIEVNSKVITDLIKGGSYLSKKSNALISNGNFYAKSAINRSRDSILNMSVEKSQIQKNNYSNSYWERWPNLREEMISNMKNILNIPIEVSRFAKTWINIKNEISNDNKLNFNEKEKMIETTAALIAHDISWYLKEEKPKILKKRNLISCELDIDSVAATFCINSNRVKNYWETHFSNICSHERLQETCCRRSNSENKYYKISDELVAFLNGWTEQILYSLTGKTNKIEQIKDFATLFRLKIIEFNKSDFKKHAKPNIIQTQIKQTSNKRYYHIPTYAADVPLHFSISVQSKTNKNSPTEGLYCITLKLDLYYIILLIEEFKEIEKLLFECGYKVANYLNKYCELVILYLFLEIIEFYYILTVMFK